MAKATSINDATLAAVVAAVSSAWRNGSPVASEPEAIARVAIRRWRSSRRRHIDQGDLAARTRDLVHGFIQQFEADSNLVGPLVRDYEHLAEKVAAALSDEAV